MVRLKPPKLPEPPGEDYVIYVRTDNGFDIESSQPVNHVDAYHVGLVKKSECGFCLETKARKRKKRKQRT